MNDLNWGQAKNILMVLFILINSLLLAIIVRTMFMEKQNEQVILDSIKVLKDRKIELNCKLPTDVLKIGNLRAKYSDITKSSQYFSFEKPKFQETRFNLENKLIPMIEENLKNKEIKFEQFVFEGFMQKDNNTLEVIYKGKYENLFVFDNSVRAMVYSDRIEGVIKYRELEITDEKHSVMQINQVLLKNFKKSKEQIIIENIRCGYIQRASKIKTLDNVYIPVWEVVLRDGRIRYYKAFTGEELMM